MHIRSLLTALSVAALCCPATTAQSGEDAPRALTTFGWQTPASVVVTEEILKKGRETTTRYRLEVTPRDGGGIRIRYRDFQFLTVGGEDVTTPAMQKAMAAATSLAAAIPDLAIATDGRFEGATGVEECVQSVVDFLAEQRKMSAEQKAQLERTMQSPAMTAVMKEGVSRYWQNWVGAWIGWDLPRGQQHDARREMPLLGTTLQADVHTEHKAPPEDKPDCVALAVTIRAKGAKFSKDMLGFVSDLAPALAAAGDAAGLDDRFVLSYRERLTVLTDPRTLLPQRATSDRTVTLRDRESDELHEQVERHDYAFDWSTAAPNKADK